MHTIQEAIPALDSRIEMEYTLAVASALVVHMCIYYYMLLLFYYRFNIFSWHFGIMCIKILLQEI